MRHQHNIPLPFVNKLHYEIKKQREVGAKGLHQLRKEIK